MKAFIILFLIVQHLIASFSQASPSMGSSFFVGAGGLYISREKTSFHTPDEWASDENRKLKRPGKDLGRDLTMKRLDIEMLRGIRLVTFSVPRDLTDDKGGTFYKNGFMTVCVKNGFLYLLSSDPLDPDKSLAHHLELIHAFHLPN